MAQRLRVGEWHFKSGPDQKQASPSKTHTPQHDQYMNIVDVSIVKYVSRAVTCTSAHWTKLMPRNTTHLLVDMYFKKRLFRNRVFLRWCIAWRIVSHHPIPTTWSENSLHTARSPLGCLCADRCDMHTQRSHSSKVGTLDSLSYLRAMGSPVQHATVARPHDGITVMAVYGAGLMAAQHDVAAASIKVCCCTLHVLQQPLCVYVVTTRWCVCVGHLCWFVQTLDVHRGGLIAGFR